ncbi:chitinase [Streptomyces sp. ID05-04B]|uniref:chitinase n=1 Tax=unclassified Streptomyces TaxID=2593676 RepID=UPI000D1BC66C|nr:MULTISPECIES: chitinase [unclassified Streptomyces]AVV41109.1 hydrolase [Streptomyces sp. P3]MDX5565593.1 chitinase [Streptomyces sp. ID05-04B]
MRSLLVPTAGVACLIALTLAGCSAQSGGTSDAAPAATGRAGGRSASGSPSTSPEESGTGTGYAPYVSAGEASGNDSAGSPTTYNLAFVIADGRDCTPKWNGVDAIGDKAVRSRISALKKTGATVRVSFGGASGTELAAACDSASALAKAYGEALDAAGSTQADFDVEGDELTDSGSIALRSSAIAALQKQRPDLEVTFTLPVMPSGLDSDSLALLASANRYDVRVLTVNLMTMNYSESYAGDMGGYAVTSATAAQAQLKKAFGTDDRAAWRGMALTSMIGTNDVDNETFTLADAAQVRAFAEEKGIAWVSMWSTFRDRECEAGAATDDALTDCSGVEQEDGAFAEAFSR